ncbi:MAG: hypothetical protein ACTSX1_00695 [Candidatus Heimdallarchaeaceae archaeon]
MNPKKGVEKMKEKLLKLLEGQNVDTEVAKQIVEAFDATINSFQAKLDELEKEKADTTQHITEELSRVDSEHKKALAQHDTNWMDKINGIQTTLKDTITEDVSSYKKKLAKKVKSFISENVKDFRTVIQEATQKDSKEDVESKITELAESIKPYLKSEESAPSEVIQKQLDEVTKAKDEAQTALVESKDALEAKTKELDDAKAKIQVLDESISTKETELKELRETVETPLMEQIDESKETKESKSEESTNDAIFEMKRLGEFTK